MDLTDYKTYKLSQKEFILYLLLILTTLIIFSNLFYDSIIMIFFFIPFAKLYFKTVNTYLCKRRKVLFCNQFTDAIKAISASLETGCSFENAIWDAYLQMSVVYSQTSYICVELYALYNQVKCSIPIEEAFSNLAARVDIDDILTFCDVINIAKRTDGNIASIIRNTAHTIGEKNNIRLEIQTSLNGKKFEQLVMLVSPLIIILYLKITTPGFFDPLYHNLFGYIFVTTCLIIYSFSIYLSVKISRIEV